MNHVLIAEDEEFLVRAIKDNLETENCVVDVAHNGEEAMQSIQKRKPDIVLLDILMPKRDGFYVLEQMKKNPEWSLVPIIVLSNLGDDTEIKRALGMGANDYFVKSEHPLEEVVEKVKEYLAGKKQTKR